MASEKERKAQQLFMDTDLTQKDIAELIGVSEQTLSKWAKNGKWEANKVANQLSKDVIIKRLYDSIAKKMEDGGVISADDAIKYAKAIDLLSGDSVNASNAINVFKRFTGWLMPQNPKLAKEVISFQKLFVTELLSDGNETN